MNLARLAEINSRVNSRRKRRSADRSNGKFVYQNLEDRRMLAANLELVTAQVVDGNLNPMTGTTLGERIMVQAIWNTTDLPSNASYRVGFTVDGVQLFSSATSAGAGISNGNGYQWFRSGWFATAGLHSVEVTVDVDNSVAEMNEKDNSFTFDFTPVTADIPVQLIWPMPGLPYQDYGVSNYTDIDPTSSWSDYNGGFSTYNGHNAIDSGPANFQAMDAGTPILAAADGTVIAVNDGEWDRQTDGFNQNPLPTANYIIIDHGSGWETFYWHLRRDSLQVGVGDSVAQGDFIGYMGSSGISTGLHIHFGVTHHGMTVEPMIDPATYWVDPFGYNGDEVYIFNSGITNYSPTAHGREGASQVTNWRQQPGQLTYVWATFSGLRQNDQVEYVWHRPNNSVYTSGQFNVSQDYGWSWWWFSRTLPATPDIGTWRVDFNVNGVKKGEQFFDVTADGAPEMRIEETNTNLIVDDRYTPLDFGEVVQNAADPMMSWRVINHGDNDLELSNLRVPDNYYVVDGLPSTLAPGASDFLTIAMDTAIAGYHAGDVRIDTNDSDESEYNFSVEGVVTTAQNQLILGISERRVGEDTTIVANVRRTGSTIGSVTVFLTDDDGSEITLPSSVTIATGFDYVMFELTTLEDYELDGDQLVKITATATSYTAATNEVVIEDGTLIPLPFGVDFGPDGSPAFQDYFTSDGEFAYSSDVGYGWLSDIVDANSFLGQRGNALVKDGVVLHSGTFVVDIPNGEYLVDMHLGIVRKTDQIQITVEGSADAFVPNAGPNVVRSYSTTVADGQLSINLDGLAGLNNLIRVSGITVTQAMPRPFHDHAGSKQSLANAWQPGLHTGFGTDHTDHAHTHGGDVYNFGDGALLKSGLAAVKNESARPVIDERSEFWIDNSMQASSQVDPDMVRIVQLQEALDELLPVYR